jgi:hypothetical protein
MSLSAHINDIPLDASDDVLRQWLRDHVTEPERRFIPFVHDSSPDTAQSELCGRLRSLFGLRRQPRLDADFDEWLERLSMFEETPSLN